MGEESDFLGDHRFYRPRRLLLYTLDWREACADGQYVRVFDIFGHDDCIRFYHSLSHLSYSAAWYLCHADQHCAACLRGRVPEGSSTADSGTPEQMALYSRDDGSAWRSVLRRRFCG